MRSGIASVVLVVGLLILGLCVGSGQEKPDEGAARIERPPAGIALPEPGPNKITYHRHVSEVERSQVFRSRLGATGELQLTHGGPPAEFPRWSRDGRQIAYALGLREHRIHIMDEDGSGDYEVPTGDVHGMQPAWRFDGMLLAFAGLSGTTWDIWIVRFDGRGRLNVTDSTAADYHPDWSPNGRSIAYDHYEGGDTNYDIYKVDSDGSHQTRLTSNGAYDGMPRWSRDGAHIVFCSGRVAPEKGRPGLEIYVMAADGSHQTRLTRRDGDDYCPCWSEDGSEILWLHGDRRGTEELWVMKADGADQRRAREDCGTHVDCWGEPRPLPEIHPGGLVRPPER